MIRMRLSEAAPSIDGVLGGADVEFVGCGTDTRSLRPGELFVALPGPRFDGHRFVADALGRGASAAMLAHASEVSLPTLLVSDTRVALGRLARRWRDRFELPVIAVTGSNGKTTVKEMLVSILATGGQVLGTRGNLNNDIGVPLTLFGLAEKHEYAVIEMGANHAGEIALLCQIAGPTIALVTQCAPAHLEGFGSVEGVARAKGEIFAGLGEEGVAVINADDEFADLWTAVAGTRRRVRFGLEARAEVTATLLGAVTDGSRFQLHTPAGSLALWLRLPGRHNVMNALAAAACTHALGLPLDRIGTGLESMRPVRGRLEACSGPRGVRVFDDTYNANPGSLQAALEVLASCAGERWLLLGDMRELGAHAEELHRHAGKMARALGVDRLYATGELSRHAVAAFGGGAKHFDSITALVASLTDDLHKDVTVLVKGSRSMQMERVVRSLQSVGP